MRAGVFSATAQPQYNITTDNLSTTAVQLAEIIRECSDYFRRRHAFLRDCYEHRRYHLGFLADPELRNSNVNPHKA